MQHTTRDAPPGFRSLDMSAVLRADRDLWIKAFDKCKSDLKVDASGRYLLDEALLALYTSSEVVFHLLPKQCFKEKIQIKISAEANEAQARQGRAIQEHTKGDVRDKKERTE